MSFFEDRIKNQFWIDRRGKCHYINGDVNSLRHVISIHNEIAQQFYPDSNRPTDVLMKLGWICVCSTVYQFPIIHKAPTQSQINRLDELELLDMLHFEHKGYYISYEKYGVLLT